MEADKQGRRKKVMRKGTMPTGEQELARALRQDPLLARLMASLGLSDVSPHRSSEELLSSLKSNNVEARANAARRLGERHEASAIPLLVARLREDEQATVRAAAAYALGEFAASAPVEPLLGALADESEHVRAAAAWALGQMGQQLPEKALLPLFAAVYNEEEDTYVRMSAVTALGNAGRQVPIEWLLGALDDADWQVRQAAALALGRQGKRVPLEALKAHINDESIFVAQAVAQSLEQLAREDAPAGEETGGSPSAPSLPPAGEPSVDQLWADEMARERPTGEGGETHGSGPGGPSAMMKSMPTFSSENESARGTGTQTVLCVPEKSGIGEQLFTSDNVEFEGLEPVDLAPEDEGEAVSLPIIAQGLDNRWATLALARAFFSGQISHAQAERYLADLARTEYIRALINGERVIILCTFLYNNPILFRDYLRPGASRDAFKQLLADGVIIPFLLHERSPVAIPDSDLDTEIFKAWQHLCEEVRPLCMRFSWDEETHWRLYRQFTGRYHAFISSLATAKDITRLAADLHVPPEQETVLRRLLAEMNTLSGRYYREQLKQQAQGFSITRDVLYTRFVTGGSNPAARLYDPKEPLAGEVKQIVDLAYNSFLADALHSYLLTPIDSPPRAILQEWESPHREQAIFTGDELLRILRRRAFSPVKEGLYLKSMGLLSLQDVQHIRGTDQWRAYIRALQRLLKTPALFSERVPEVYNCYVELARRMTAQVAACEQATGEKLAAWEPSIKVQASIGGASLSFVWNRDGAFFSASDRPPYVVAENGEAPFSLRLIIGESGARQRPDQASLFSSLELIKGKMPDALNEWGRILRALGKKRGVEAYSPDRVRQVNAPTLNEQEL